MKAITYSSFGSADVLGLAEIEKPVVDDDLVLVRIHGAAVNPLDWHFMTGKPYITRLAAGVRKPKVTTLGADMAGRVEAVGSNVTKFKIGDEVFGRARSGAFAEFTSAAEKRVALKPVNLTFEQAATVPIAAITALQALRKAKIEPGQKVLINGASGGVGTFAVQIAKAQGAEVTGVCSSRNVEMVRSIGADHVVDYTTDDAVASDERYDVIFDNMGNWALRDCKKLMEPKGVYLLVGGSKTGRWLGPLKHDAWAFLYFMFASQKKASVMASITTEDLDYLAELLVADKVAPVIGHTYRLEDVPEALSHIGEGHAQGKIAISI